MSTNKDYQISKHFRKLAALIIAAAVLTIGTIPSFAENMDGISQGSAVSSVSAEIGAVDAEETASEAAAEEAASESAEEEKATEAPPEKDAGIVTGKPAEKNVKKAPAMAASKDDTVSYTSALEYTQRSGGKKMEIRVFKGKVGGKSFEGTCAQIGVKAKSSGTATLTKVDNTSRTAKLIYHYGIELGWWRGSQANKSAKSTLGVDFSVNTTKRLLVEYMSQIGHMSEKKWKDGATSNAGFTESYANTIYKCITKLSVANVKVPDTFEMYYGSAGSGNQDFSLWYYTPPVEVGHVEMQKVSADTDLTGIMQDDPEGED